MHVGFGTGAEQLADGVGSGSSQCPFRSSPGLCGFQAKGAACSVFAAYPVELLQSVDEANRSGVGQVQDPAKLHDAQPGIGDDRGRCCADQACESSIYLAPFPALSGTVSELTYEQRPLRRHADRGHRPP